MTGWRLVRDDGPATTHPVEPPAYPGDLGGEWVKRGEAPSWMTEVMACDPHDGYCTPDGTAYLGSDGSVWAMTADIKSNPPTS